jgi:deoxyxylulose-5-phosphate synthase
MLLRLAREHEALMTIEEGPIRGLGAHAMQALGEHGVLDQEIKVRSMALPDKFIDQDVLDFIATAFEVLGRNSRVRMAIGVRF